jgi:hypothetical protein
VPPAPPTYGVGMSVAKGKGRATFTITNTGNTTAGFRIAQSILTKSDHKGPKPPKPPKPGKPAFEIVTTLNGANVSKSIGAGTTTFIPAGGSAQVVVKIKVRRKITFDRAIRILLASTNQMDTTQSAAAQTTLDLKASK